MQTEGEGFIGDFTGIVAGFKALDPPDQDKIVSLGALLEQLFAETSEAAPKLSEFIGMCLQSLQSLYLGTADQPELLVSTLVEAGSIIEQGLSLQDDDKRERSIETAMAILDTVKSGSAEEGTPTSAASLDDVASLLVQSSATDAEDIAAIKQALLAASCGTYSATVKDCIAQALEIADQLIQRMADDPDAAFGELSNCVESAINSIEESDWIEDTAPVKEPVREEVREEPRPEVTESDVLPADADSGLLSEFVTECTEYIEGAEVALLALETDPADIESVNTVFRAFHTIKGTSAFLGLQRISELAHKAESLLSRVRDGEIVCTGGYADLALRSIDMLKELLHGVQDALNGQPMVKPDHYDSLMDALINPEASGYTSERSKPALQASKPEIEEPVESAPVLTLTTTELTPVADPAPIRTQRKPTNSDAVDSSVRVRTDRLDKLIDTVGELVIAQSMVVQDGTVVDGEHHDLAKKVIHMSKIVRELQYLSMSMRMVPLKPTFQKMARLVRDVALKSGKQVEFISEGEDTEIDRNMVDVVNEPLVHMIRNAVDHGIETPEARQAANKDIKGIVRLSARHAGGNVIVEMRDDGKGLDRDKIVQKAISKGLIDSDRGMTDGEVYNLIFEPGFSTADKVTDISGRGVGLDVVKKSVEALRGRIELSSERGNGTTFTIRLPLTMAVTDGMLVRVGRERFIIPTISIHKSFRPSADSLSTVTGRGEMVMLRGELMAVFRLYEVLDIEDAVEDPTQGLLVILDDGDRKCALLVDELLGQQHVVAKPLSEGIGKLPGVSGGAILGDGRVGLILDPSEIASLARQCSEVGTRRQLTSRIVA